jgi:hypothetical protein
MKTFLLTAITLISLYSNAQKITPKPIYEGLQSLRIVELGSGEIGFIYQNPEYSMIIDLISFTCKSKTDAIKLMDKVIFILEMGKTDKEQNIIDEFESISLVRYGISQKVVYCNGFGLRLNLKICNKIKKALESYEYLNQSNK